jgi:hypothetical protein
MGRRGSRPYQPHEGGVPNPLLPRLKAAGIAVIALVLQGCSTHVPEVSISRDPGPMKLTGASATASAEVQVQAEKDQKDCTRSVRDQVNQSWKAALAAENPAPRNGLIVIEFSVHRDGSVSDFRKLTEGSEGPPMALCEKVIRAAAPFPAWTPSMVEAFPSDYVKYRYTFYFDRP